MSRQVQEGSTWLTQVGHTALPGDKGTAHPRTWPVSRSCPLPPHQAGNARPQAPTGETGPGISLCQGSCNSPCPWEYLLVRTSGDAPLSQASLPQLQGPGQAQSKLTVFAGVPALQPSQGSEQKTEVPRAGAAPGAAGWQGQHFLMGSVGLLLPSGPWCGGIQGAPVCCPLSRPSHQRSWQTSPFTHPYQGPDGRGADGPFESLPSVPPQDTLKGKPWKSLFYFGPTRASSTAHLRRGWAGGNGPRRRVRPEGPGGNIQHKVQTTTTTSCPPSWSTCTGLTRHFKHFTSPSRIQAPSRSWDSNRDEHEPSPLCRNISRAAGHLCLEGTRAEEQSTGKSSSCHQGAERARGVHLENKKFGETLLQPFGAYRGL